MESNGIPYVINRSIGIHNFEKDGELNMELVKDCRDSLGCDHVLRNQTHFIFVNKIEEINE